jgi:hypothetical protein
MSGGDDSASGNQRKATTPTMRQMYYDILTRQSSSQIDQQGSYFLCEALRDQLRQQIEAKRPD